MPDAPTQPVRDPWPGDINLGVRLLRGELEFGGGVLLLRPGAWSGLSGAEPLLTYRAGFAWLRHLRSLGTDPARMLPAASCRTGWRPRRPIHRPPP